ncbi:MAG: hypothetical protein MOIL_01380 [Candidatus Methanolliviera sp. GoM_oil]|nr:MAG: hypothetical protein MOIL_01380 [Candidatus Methanolliviera sp. GoM_oil]
MSGASQLIPMALFTEKRAHVCEDAGANSIGATLEKLGVERIEHEARAYDRQEERFIKKDMYYLKGRRGYV